MRATVVIVGAGQAGLAMSRCLTDRAIDHVVLERGEVAHSWRHERWDSLRLLTPNWLSRLPSWHYSGEDPDGYMTAADFAVHLDRYRASFDAPVRSSVEVLSLRTTTGGFEVATSEGPWSCRAVVVATGPAAVAKVPPSAALVPPDVEQVTSLEYRNPGSVPGDGTVLVSGASASGVQIADELRRAGRPVVVAAGEHTRVPRRYRGMDIHWWMDAIGLLDERPDDIPDLDRARRLPALQLIGTTDRRDLDLAALAAQGVEVVGRLASVDDRHLYFSGSLPNLVASADLKMGRLLDRIDEFAREHGLDDELDAPVRPQPVRLARATTRRRIDDVDAIVWATGVRADHRWIDDSLLDRYGVLRHDGGRSELPGLYVLGLPFLRRRKSIFIDGAGADAAELSVEVARHVGALSASS
jgi:putative flavoprotein involved in K+ transport